MIVNSLKVVLIAAALTVAACTAEPGQFPSINVTSYTNTDDIEMASQAIKVFLNKGCPDLAKYAGDVESFEATIGAEPVAGYRTEKFGWTKEIDLQIRISQDATRIPPDSYARGHTLHYYLGAGTTPGVIIQKDQSYALCGAKEGSWQFPFGRPGGDGILSLPSLAFIDAT
jgi:hypothetical protein